jgi:hypothetical protein
MMSCRQASSAPSPKRLTGVIRRAKPALESKEFNMDTQGEAAERRAPAPMPLPRAANQPMHVPIAGRFEWLRRFPIASWAPIPLRLIVGYGFMEHGFAKLARGPDAFPAILQALGVPAPDGSRSWLR